METKVFFICSAPKWISGRERDTKKIMDETSRNRQTPSPLRRLRGWLVLNQKEQEMNIRVPSTISFTGTARWVPFMAYLVMEPLV